MTELSRRTLLQGSLAAAGAALVAPAVQNAAAQGGFDWQRFKGAKIEVAFQRTPFHDVLQQSEKDFTALTGIQVGSEQVPEQQFRQKLAIELASGRPNFDVCYVAQATQKRMMGKGRYLADLRPLIQDATLTAPDFAFDDFAKPALAAATQLDGKLDTLPLTFAYNMLMVNNELLQKAGLAAPTNFTELLAAARKLHDPANGISGFVARGLKNANTPIWTSFMLGHGVDAVDPDGRLRTDGPEAIASAQLYQQLVKDCGPAGVTGFNWYECQALFMQGKAAMWIDTSTVGATTVDPAKSRIADKAGFAVMPMGPVAHRAPVFGAGMGIAAATRQLGPSWFYLQWATGKALMARQVAGGYGASGRMSSYEAAKTSTDAKLSREWLNVVERSSTIAHPVLPDIVAANEFRDVFGVALTNMLTGGDPAAELRKATEGFKPILERTEKA